jgi:hypothetical protein
VLCCLSSVICRVLSGLTTKSFLEIVRVLVSEPDRLQSTAALVGLVRENVLSMDLTLEIQGCLKTDRPKEDAAGLVELYRSVEGEQLRSLGRQWSRFRGPTRVSVAREPNLMSLLRREVETFRPVFPFSASQTAYIFARHGRGRGWVIQSENEAHKDHRSLHK